MSSHLTDAEREALGIFDNGTYSCACRGEVCESIPCRNDRNDLLTTVEHILTTRLAAIGAGQVPGLVTSEAQQE